MSLMTQEQFDELFMMVKAIYNGLGLDGSKIVSYKTIEAQARQDVERFRKRHERKTKKGPSGQMVD